MEAFRVEEEYREVLARAGITDFTSAMAFSGGHLVSAHRGRSVVRIEGAVFLKRFVLRPGEAEREQRAMALLSAGPGPAPVPVAAAGSGPGGAFLATVRPEGALPLPEALRVLAGRARRDLARSLGAKLAALHARGLSCPDLLAHHLLVRGDGGVYLLDAGRLARRRGRRAAARDLAALELSLPFGVATATDRLRFLAAYLGGREGIRGWVARIGAAFRGLDRRSRHRTKRFVAAPADAAFLAEHGIRSFADLMEYAGAGAVRRRVLRDRENWRVDLGGRTFFVKRHRPVRGLGKTPAAGEWEAARLLRRLGIRAMRPAAYGEDVRGGSAIWVDGVPGEPLDGLLSRGAVPPSVRRELVLEAAGILARMRRFSIHHRDFYCCHLIADLAAPAGRRLTVIDLQRVRRRERLRERWYVKDVAQLLHSAPRPPVTGADGVRFLRAYFGVARLGPREKSFARRVARKASRIR
jgi:hypothetical protein